MSSFIYLAGSRFNLYRRGTVSVSPAAASSFGSVYLYDDDPSTPHIAGSIAADSYMRVTNNGLTNGGFESDLTGWTDADAGASVSSITTTAGEFNSGTKGLKLQFSGSDYAARTQTFTANAGEYRKASVYMKAAGGGSFVTLTIQNLRTGKFLNSSSAWVSSATAILVSATSWTLSELTYQVESFETCRADTVSLKWTLTGVDGTVFVDDCKDMSGVSFASVHGHNYGGGVSPLVQSSDDGSAWTTRATMTIRRPAFFSTFDIIYAEYWQIKLSGTNHEAPYTGEAVLGQYTTAATPLLAGPLTDRDIPGSRNMGTSGRPSAYSYATDARESIRMVFSADSLADATKTADEIWLRSSQGQYPAIVVPIDTEALVYYGRVTHPFSMTRPNVDIYDYGIDLIGDPLPTVGA